MRYIFKSFWCCNFMYKIFVFCLRGKTNTQTTKENLFFYLNRTWVTLTQARVTLSNISLFFKRKREKGWGVLLCLPSGGTKTFANWKLRNHKSDVNKTCLTYVPPLHLSFSKKWAWQLMGGQGAHPKNRQKMLWNSQNLHFNIT